MNQEGREGMEDLVLAVEEEDKLQTMAVVEMGARGVEEKLGYINSNQTLWLKFQSLKGEQQLKEGRTEHRFLWARVHNTILAFMMLFLAAPRHSPQLYNLQRNPFNPLRET